MLQHTIHEITPPLLRFIIDPPVQSLSNKILLVVSTSAYLLAVRNQRNEFEEKRIIEHAAEQRTPVEEVEHIVHPVMVDVGRKAIEALAEGEVAYDVEGGIVVPKSTLSANCCLPQVPPWKQVGYIGSAVAFKSRTPKDRLTI